MKLKVSTTTASTLFFLISVIFLNGCGIDKSYQVIETDNPEFIPNTQFVNMEDLSSPKFTALKEKYKLDTIFHGEIDEFKRILLIRSWIRKIIDIDNIGPYPGDGSAESILDEALKGHRFHCGHYMTVMNAILNAYGYVTRCLGAGEGSPPRVESHHAINEVWSNTYGKWVLLDAKYDYHFEKMGLPLSALEVRHESLLNGAKDIVLVKGIDRVPTEFYPELDNRPKSEFARVYTWITWQKYGDAYTGFPTGKWDNLIALKDNYTKSHVWIREGKQHWAYNTPALTEVSDINVINWTPNTIRANVEIDGKKATIKLQSDTPNFSSYQMKQGEDEWIDVREKLTLELKRDREEILFHTVNKAGVSGQVYKVIVQLK